MSNEQLIYASRDGDLATVRRLLSSKGVDVNYKNGWGSPALIWASYNGHIDVVKTLLEHNAKVDIQRNDGYTALMGAGHNDHIEVVKALLERNANIDIQDDFGWTALMPASCNGHIDCVRLLLENGANVTLEDEYGETAKDMAQEKGHWDIVKLIDQVCSSHIIESYPLRYLHGMSTVLVLVGIQQKVQGTTAVEVSQQNDGGRNSASQDGY